MMQVEASIDFSYNRIPMANPTQWIQEGRKEGRRMPVLTPCVQFHSTSTHQNYVTERSLSGLSGHGRSELTS